MRTDGSRKETKRNERTGEKRRGEECPNGFYSSPGRGRVELGEALGAMMEDQCKKLR